MSCLPSLKLLFVSGTQNLGTSQCGSRPQQAKSAVVVNTRQIDQTPPTSGIRKHLQSVNLPHGIDAVATDPTKAIFMPGRIFKGDDTDLRPTDE